ncbi:putative histone acetyltransferase HAC-like 1 [Apostasia shenzhenica]|uniref:histone acetyltransferase n=1 Tax=Apostasia shenzhenica TaxID=1088818 RepID=A0A2I0ABK4_9ASPA|nr:putative histone acetyltransferase HAC-like 1 [Apostasia shenzhenica]
MNLPVHLSGQISGQVPNQAGPQMAGPSQTINPLSSQMQNLSAQVYGMDPELLICRRKIQDAIIQLLQRKNLNPNSDVMQRIPELARRLEEHIYRDSVLQGEDYRTISWSTVEQRLQRISKVLNNSQQANYVQSPSVSTMIPTPGLSHNVNKGPIISQVISMTAASGGNMLAQNIGNKKNVLPDSNGSIGVGQVTSFNAPTGNISNGYSQTSSNIVHNSGRKSMMSSVGVTRQSSQMIPTPGLNNQPSLCMNSESSNGSGYSGLDSALGSQQQQKQFVGSQNSYVLHGLCSGVGLRSNMQHKPLPYSFSNGVMNEGIGGLLGNNMNGSVAPEGFLGSVSYGSSQKPLQQRFDKQHFLPSVPISTSQQILPLAGDGYTMNPSDLSGSENIYNSIPPSVSSVSSENLNPGMDFKPEANHRLLTNHTSLPPMQHNPQLKPQIIDSLQNMDIQPAQSTTEQLLLSHHQLQNFQHQQFQQPNEAYSQLIQHQGHQHNQQHHQVLSKADILRQPSLPSTFGGIESNSESFPLQDNEQFHFSELRNCYLQNSSSGNSPKAVQLLAQTQGPQVFQPSASQASQKMSGEQTTQSQNELSCLFVGSQCDAFPQETLYPQHPKQSSFEQHMQEEFHQRSIVHVGAQHPTISHDVHVSSTRVTVPESLMGNGGVNCKRERDYFNQKRWLLLLLHSRKCPFAKGQCKEVNCSTVQQLWTHIDMCKLNFCMFPRCSQSRKLFNHYKICKAAECPVCVPVHEFIASANAHSRTQSCPSSGNQMNGIWKNINSPGFDNLISKAGLSPTETDDQLSLYKRMKVQHNPPLIPKSEASPASVSPTNQIHTAKETKSNEYHDVNAVLPFKSEVLEIKLEAPLVSRLGPVSGRLDDVSKNVTVKPSVEPCPVKEVEVLTKKEVQPVDETISQHKIGINQETNRSPIDAAAASKSGKPKIKGVSLTELFTPEQIREHITSLRQWVGQSKAKAEKNQAMERSMSENSCQLCAVEKLTFEPPPIYCTPCGGRIKRNATYYTVGTGESRHYFCIPCYNEARSDTIEAEGSSFPKSRLEKKKNDEETEEWWVQCDKCEAWQHQICALFNGRRNDGGQAEYTCPNCYIEEIEKGERKPLPQSAVLGAKDLPRSILSDNIEQRLFRRLKQERQERARQLGKSVEEVPGAEGLVIRVVSSVDKKLEVKPRFLEIFQEENYPTEFAYKSKVILLFQKIEGVEVCLFGMYVQEFGSECQFPNQRRIYLSYLDSVKYFRPDIKTVTGEALRTFVYHEILIGYLDYCKKRGFTSCYIWACPPLKGEDYILYCHPEIQKTPKSDKLREWYLSMLRKAFKENIVVGLTNLYDHFFVSTGECKAKVTAARLPYFDGDYWPGAAEDMINQLRQEEDCRKQQRKGKTKMTLTKRALKAAGHTDLSTNASKDVLLMQKLGETICPMKEDFIMVHLQHACSHCCILMVAGNRWVCSQCKNFQICDKCYEAEQKLDDRDRHPSNSRELHNFYPIEITDLSDDTEDKDEIVESEFFDTRQAFLSLCQGNHYQYDTLRRAKHSSMMVLYHLHNPTAPAFVTTCIVCHHDIETGQGWRCEVCPDFDVCNACYQKDGGIDHPHKLTNHPSNTERDAQSQEARQKRVLQLRKMLDLLVHASQCRFPHCLYPNCRKVKGLFRHGIHCRTRASGGCLLCKKMWYLLQLHARACKESDCNVPRCRDLKEHLRRLQQQSESRRRAAVNEMMRQRAAELQATDS